ncbi:MAG: energy-coupling factor ABC transporter ATP-binding protein [Ruminococcus bromii]|nr:energy-coupling factor ABC transporter ATP-binding protein [Ruminococcus bromii]
MIQFENVSLTYGAAQAVRDLTITIPDGAFVALIGANGAGKTTTAKLMRGLLKPTAGRVLVDGVSTAKCRTSALAKKIGFLFQNPDRQLCRMTVREEIAFGLELIGAQNIRDRVEAVLNDFGFDGDRDPFSMSRGERQRIALASLIAAEPGVLILDEPTTGLDYRECMAMMARIQALNAQGTTVVMVCHDMELVLDFAERVLVFSAGQLLLDGKTREVFRNTAALEAASVLPPQMTRLSDLLPPADTVEEMERAIRMKRGQSA